MTKTKRSIHLSASLNERFNALPITKSAAVSSAVKYADHDVDAVVRALKFRLMSAINDEANDVKTSIYLDPRVDEKLENLSLMTKLPVEQVVRLAMEAYIHKL